MSKKLNEYKRSLINYFIMSAIVGLIVFVFMLPILPTGLIILAILPNAGYIALLILFLIILGVILFVGFVITIILLGGPKKIEIFDEKIRIYYYLGEAEEIEYKQMQIIRFYSKIGVNRISMFIMPIPTAGIYGRTDWLEIITKERTFNINITEIEKCKDMLLEIEKYSKKKIKNRDAFISYK